MRNNIIAAAIAATSLISLTGCSIFGGGDGTPSANAESIDKNLSTSGSVSEAKKYSEEIRSIIDELVGYGGYDKLSSGDKSTWQSFASNHEFRDLPTSLKTAFQNSGINASDVSKMQSDCDNLESLYIIASNHHDKTGAEALKYYHRVAEDVNYYLTHQGEEYGVSHIQGGYQPIEKFIQQNK